MRAPAGVAHHEKRPDAGQVAGRRQLGLVQHDGRGREQLAGGPRHPECRAVEERDLAVRMEEAGEEVGHGLHVLARPERHVVVGREQDGDHLDVVGEHEAVHDRAPAAVAAVLVHLLAELVPQDRRARLEPAPRLRAVEEAAGHEEGAAGADQAMVGRLVPDRGRQRHGLRLEALERRPSLRRIGPQLRGEEGVQVE